MPSKNQHTHSGRSSHVWRHTASRSRTPAKEHPSKTRRRRRFFALIVLFLIIILCIGLFIWGTYQTEVKISRITFFGLHTISEEEIRPAVEAYVAQQAKRVPGRDNQLLFPREYLARDLVTNNPRIERVGLALRGMTTPVLSITVVEREPEGVWCSAEANCFFLDKKGFVYATTTDKTGFVEFRGGQMSSSTSPIGTTFVSDFQKIVSMLTSFSQEGYEAKEVEIVEDELTIFLTRGFVVKTLLSHDAEKTAETLGLVLGSESLRGKSDALEYVDLRFGNRVYFKFKNNTEVLSEEE